ncbi:interleukin-1 receptor type 2 isoform X2 [Cyprinodon tularosa]|uniref:interleukin-1 receptor type 2 isoform X2 n=1 Tax=Cyprinodon tularosa TaxID=77115 RepID=UPI0018E1DDD1|nr:interleukin-1 receptor type 2 isoform X2 [Cyprinodon tularosa]
MPKGHPVTSHRSHSMLIPHLSARTSTPPQPPVYCVHGARLLPPLPMKDGCYQESPEVEVFRVEGEAVILQFPIFMRGLQVRKIAPPLEKYLISRNNGSDQLRYQSDGRVQQQGKELWFLPAQPSDSGEYTCTYRNETYCVTGSITLHVYESSSVDIEKLSYPWPALVGETVEFNCPSLESFNQTGRPIQWYKDSNPTPLQPGRATLMIPAVKHSHAGVYTCQLTALIHNQQYKVSRAILLHVKDPAITTSVPDVSTPSEPAQPSSRTPSTTSVIKPPVIISPRNGTIFEGPHGSSLELFCQVLTECPLADSTVVTWLVNSQSVESSYLERRALQGGRRVNRVSEMCQIEQRLIIAVITEEDEQTELKCVTQNTSGRQEVVSILHLEDTTFTWLVVAVVTVICFLMMVSAFLYILFKPKTKKKMDYILARQSSTFSV